MGKLKIIPGYWKKKMLKKLSKMSLGVEQPSLEELSYWYVQPPADPPTAELPSLLKEPIPKLTESLLSAQYAESMSKMKGLSSWMSVDVHQPQTEAAELCGSQPVTAVPLSLGSKEESEPSASNDPIIWRLSSARLSIEAVQGLAQRFNYHLCLGGGVLNNGASTKDLDLYALPLKEEKSRDIKGLIRVMITTFGRGEAFSHCDDYPDTSLPYVAKIKFPNNGRRVDLFIIGAQQDCIENLQEFLEVTAEEIIGVAISLKQDRIVHLPRRQRTENEHPF